MYVCMYVCMHAFVSLFMIKLMFRSCSVVKNMVLEEKGKQYNKRID